MPTHPLLAFRRTLSVATEPPSPIEALAQALVSVRGPTEAHIRAFKRAVGWREHATGDDAKLNFRAQQLLKRHVKRLSADERAYLSGRRRLADLVPVPEQLRQAHKSAKKALHAEPALRREVEQLTARAEDAERARDTLELQGAKLADAFLPYFARRLDVEALANEPQPVPRHARRSSRSLKQRPHSAHILSLPPLPDESTSRSEAHGVFSRDIDMLPSDEDSAHAF